MKPPFPDLTIGALASQAGVHVETIRFYQRKGLVHQPARPAGGVRRYGATDLGRLRFIKSAQHLGFSLEEVAQLLKLEDGGHCDAVRAQAQDKLLDVRNRLAGLQRMELALAELVDQCGARPVNVRCPLIAALQGGDTTAPLATTRNSRMTITFQPAPAHLAADYVRLRGLTRENAVPEERLRALGITAESWAQDIRSKTLQGMMALSDRQMVAYCFGNSNSGEVVVLAVLPSFEGQGIGRQLLSLVVELLHRQGHTRLFLACAADPAVRSHGFYRHLGWRSTGTFDERGDELLELMPEQSLQADGLTHRGRVT